MRTANMTLRDQCVKAALRAMDDHALQPQDFEGFGIGQAEVALDAILDTLAGAVREWWDQAGDLADSEPLRSSYETWAGDLIAVLRREED